MAYDENLADRIERTLKDHNVNFEVKKMMGGLCYMVKDKMSLGIVKNNLMARIDPGVYEDALKRKGCREMDFTGRPMKGFVFVEPDGMDLDKDLEYWVKLALDYNAIAPVKKKSKKK
jgi:TfoX/Sxy family transcriptional regulator of competence genes